MIAGSMRVLSLGNVYPPHHLGGYEVIWRGVTESLRADGHAVRVLTTDYRGSEVAPGQGDDPDVYRELGWYWRDHDWPRMTPWARLQLERRNAELLARHLAEFRPDVVAWWPVGGMSLGLIEQTRRAGIPAVFFVLDYWPRYGPEHDLWLRLWRRVPGGALVDRLTGLPTRLGLDHAGRWVFCSQVMLEDTVASGVKIDDWTILAPGIERSYLEQPPEPSPPAWRWRLLYIGRVVEQKGVHTAIEALAQSPGEASLRIVGEGDQAYRQRLERLAAKLAVADRVEFRPPRPRAELASIYREADAVVFPVEWAEPWGLVPLEAMALGRPVLATGRGGSGDYLRDGENCLLFEPGNAGALASSLSRVANEPALRERLRAGGLETAQRHQEDEFNRLAIEQLAAVVPR
jgi:glycogen(starch) synthase